jgi:pyridoxamine 5'-phosphate oxidase family protein
VFTPAEASYVKSQLLARLATVAPDGTVQNSPVGFFLNNELNTFDIWGQRMGRPRSSQCRTHPQVALVIDDLESVTPWIARGLRSEELRAAEDLDPPARITAGGNKDPPRQDHQLGSGRGRSVYLTSGRHVFAD